MKRRSFQEYLEERLDKSEIAEIKEEALKEKNILFALIDQEPRLIFRKK